MLEKLQAIARRLDQVERQLSDPAIYADREMLTRLSREQKELTPIAAAFRAWQQAEDDSCPGPGAADGPRDAGAGPGGAAPGPPGAGPPVGGAASSCCCPGTPTTTGTSSWRSAAASAARRAALFAADLLPDVHHVCRAPGLEHGDGVLKTTRSWAASRRPAPPSRARGPGPA